MCRTQFCMCISHLKFIVLFAYGERRERIWGGGTRPLRGVAWPKPIRISAFVQSIQKYRNTGGVINQKWSTARKEKQQQQRRWEGRKGGRYVARILAGIGKAANINIAARRSTEVETDAARKSRQRSQYNDDKRATCGISYRFHFKIYATYAFSLSM